MEDRYRKKVRIDKETSSITVVLEDNYWCAIDINDKFKDMVMATDSVAKLNDLFSQISLYKDVISK